MSNTIPYRNSKTCPQQVGTSFDPSGNAFTPAFNLLLHLAFRADETPPAAFREADEEALTDKLSFHRLLPQLYQQLVKSSLFEPSFIEKLQVKYLLLREESLAQSLELFSMLKCFKEQKIEVICLKGPILAYQLYGDFTKRSSNDLDFLIDPQNLYRALKMLLDEGYLIDGVYPKTPKQKLAFLKARHHYTLFHPQKKITVELHWKLFAGYTHQDWNFATLFPSCQSLVFSETTVSVLADLDAALYLCVHGSRHLWSRLFWLHDLMSFLERKEADFALHLLEFAQQKQLEIHVWNALLLLNQLGEKKYVNGLPRVPQHAIRLEKLTYKKWGKLDQKPVNGSKKRFTWSDYSDFYTYLYHLEGFKGLTNEWRTKRIKPDNWDFFVFPDSVFSLNQFFSRPIWFLRNRFGA